MSDRQTGIRLGSGLVCRSGLVVIALSVLAGCDSLLDVRPDPHTIDADHPIGLSEMMVGATADLFMSYDSKIVFAGLFGDEFVQSGTAHFNFATRTVTAASSGGGTRSRSIGGPYYFPLQRAVAVSDIAQERILAGDFTEIVDPLNSPQYALVSTYSGFAKTWLSDMYCTLAFGGQGPELSQHEAYSLAEGEFTSAIEAAGADADTKQAALVGRARVRLILGDDQGAVADAEQVDPEFEWMATYSTNSFEQRNRVHFRTWDFGNWSVDPTFRHLTIDDTGEADPRVSLAHNPRPAYEPTQELYAPWKVSSPNAPLRIATGDEARLIIAEVIGGADAVALINEVRARHGISTEWTPETSSPDEVRDKLIDERRRTLFLDGVRMGDLRRYIDKYGLDFFSTSIPQGHPMGDQTCFPLPDVERENNPGLSS